MDLPDYKEKVEIDFSCCDHRVEDELNKALEEVKTNGIECSHSVFTNENMRPLKALKEFSIALNKAIERLEDKNF